jgi:hypothetical protein
VQARELTSLLKSYWIARPDGHGKMHCQILLAWFDTFLHCASLWLNFESIYLRAALPEGSYEGGRLFDFTVYPPPLFHPAVSLLFSHKTTGVPRQLFVQVLHSSIVLYRSYSAMRLHGLPPLRGGVGCF